MSISAGAPYSVSVRVYYQDTDAGGVVYHARYLDFMERARTELLNARGFDLARFADQSGILFMVHGITVRYHRPARLNDLLAATVRVATLRPASMDFEQRVERGPELLVEARVRLALVDRDRQRPVRMPAALRQILETTG